MLSAMNKRDYSRVAAAVRPDGDREACMRVVVEALWEELHDKGCSWIGFYVKSPNADELVLGPRRDKPACSPIGMHGACGRSFLRVRPLIVTDVKNLGGGYIACDPRDRSEAVLPCVDSDGVCWGVLDADSFDVDAFGLEDVAGMHEVLLRAGLTSVPAGPVESV